VRGGAASPDGNRIYTGGSLGLNGGLARWRLISLDASSGAVDPNRNSAADSGVHALVDPDDRLYTGGDFPSIDEASRLHLPATSDMSTEALDAS
jgi:hypothetical protein